MTMDALGIDLGSVSAHVAAVRDGEVVWARSRPTAGKGLAVLSDLLDEALDELGDGDVALGLTGGARSMLGEVLGDAGIHSEVMATARGAAALCPGARNGVEIGGHMSRWISLHPDGGGDVDDFALSDLCAAGAGAFLEQQASRMRMGIEELASVAAEAPRGAAVAGRCAVFAKSDMIHLQQKGTPAEEIAYGLCLALIRNFQSTVLRGRTLQAPVALLGGGALNAGLVRAVREVLELDGDDLRIPDHPQAAAAAGAALLGGGTETLALAEVARRIRRHPGRHGKLPRLPALPDPGTEPPPPEPRGQDLDGTRVLLGVDVGSVSTNLALVTEDGTVVDAVYLRTRGRPLEVLREGLAMLRGRHAERVEVVGVGTTGSGRHLAGWFLGADLVRNEITAQLRAAVQYMPDVDTVLEIGGQDSKYIQVRDGHIVDFTMNKICAAGTGSFLEEQADRLGISIVDEFADHALRGERPVDLGSRCTVFMDTELVHALRGGATTEEVTAGLALSVARNYLDRVVAGRPVGQRVFFQGGTASNRAVVAAFRQLLGRPVQVHPYNRVSGAVGATLLVQDARADGRIGAQTAFKGFDGCTGELDRSFECPKCSNRCQVNRFRSGSDVFYFGDTCEMYTSKVAGRSKDTGVRDVLVAMERSLHVAAGLDPDEEIGEVRDGEGTIGIPRAGMPYALLPLWTAMVRAAGKRPVLSSPSSTALLAEGLKRTTAETCLPVKMAYGHVVDLVRRGVRRVLLPSVIATPLRPEPNDRSYTCPYTQYLPYMVRTSVDVALIAPQLSLAEPADQALVDREDTAAALGISPRMLDVAVREGLRDVRRFHDRVREIGRETLAAGEAPILVVMGKPYNLLDPFLNLGLGRHLARLGLPFVPMGSLPLDDVRLGERFEDLPWGVNRDYLRAAMVIRRDPRLFPVVLSSFGCGPDGFTVKHLDAILEGKPRLLLELDEHRAEAGLITRIEAFADEIEAFLQRESAEPLPEIPSGPVVRSAKRPTRVFLPHIADHAHVFAGALRRAGHEAIVLPPPDDEVRLAGEELASGRECHAYSIVAGDLAQLARSRDVQDGDAFLFPGAVNPCLIPQYRDAMLYGLKRIGGPEIEIITPLAEDLLEMFGMRGLFLFWEGLVATDLLIRAACEVRPYERDPGATDRVHARNIEAISEGVEEGGVVEPLRQGALRLAEIDTAGMGTRPLVGVAGDIYTRINEFASGDLFHRLEALGCEVWPAPTIVDTTDFTTAKNILDNAKRREIRAAMRLKFYETLKDADTERMRGAVSGMIRDRKEPTFDEVLELTAPYAGPETHHLALLNLAKVIDFAHGGASGVVNAICFNCMIGTVSAAMLDRLRADHDGIPMATLVYGGTGGTSSEARLEAFVHQVHRFHERNRGRLQQRVGS